MSRCTIILLVSILALFGLGGLSVSRELPRPIDSAAHQFPVRRVSPLVFSGPTPRGVPDMRHLSRLGVRTVVSVDGARPDVTAAAAAGLGYVHVPIGYDGVPQEALAALMQVIQQRSLPVYVHCHHGKHRGPTAAAMCAMLASELSHDQARTFLETSGTSPNYPGLWKSVETFQPLPPGTPLPMLVPVAEVDPLVEMMLHIDQRFEMLTTLIEPQHRELKGTAAASGPDSEVQRIARLLHEDLRESTRMLGGDWPAGMVLLMQKAERQTEEILDRLQDHPHLVPEVMDNLQATCNECHRRYRN